MSSYYYVVTIYKYLVKYLCYQIGFNFHERFFFVWVTTFVNTAKKKKWQLIRRRWSKGINLVCVSCQWLTHSHFFFLHFLFHIDKKKYLYCLLTTCLIYCPVIFLVRMCSAVFFFKLHHYCVSCAHTLINQLWKLNKLHQNKKIMFTKLSSHISPNSTSKLIIEQSTH